jgi:phosphoribosylformimino-5-aminoimidazole carboxamide ribotide isomerase
MKILPAIDLKDGRCVRLFQGEFDKEEVVNAEPLAQVKKFVDNQMTHLHIVDLDGALEGVAVHKDLIMEMKRLAPDVFVEVGGGIRTMVQIEAYLAAGIDRVIIGSAALKNPELVKSAVAKFGDKIAVGIDAKNGLVAISGWLEVAEVDYLTFAKEMAAVGVSTIIYTDISKDGTLAGPSVEHYEALVSALPDTAIIASGGVASFADLVALEKIGVAGTIVGKAYYSGKITLKEMAEVNQ